MSNQNTPPTPLLRQGIESNRQYIGPYMLDKKLGMGQTGNQRLKWESLFLINMF